MIVEELWRFVAAGLLVIAALGARPAIVWAVQAQGAEVRADARGLVAELERRLERARAIAAELGLDDTCSAIDRIAERAADLDRQPSAGPERRVTRERAGRVLAEARRVQRTLTPSTASPALVEEWNGVIATLTELAGGEAGSEP